MLIAGYAQEVGGWRRGNDWRNECKWSSVVCRRLAKSALVLIPLFGVPYMLFLGAQYHYISEEMELVKLYFEMTFNSFNVSTTTSLS